MKIEFLADGSQDCPVIRMFEFEEREIDHLRHACRVLADRTASEFALHEQDWAQPIDGCQFIWRYSEKELGSAAPANR